MIPEGLRGFPYPTIKNWDDSFSWNSTGSITPAGMICRQYGCYGPLKGFSYLDSHEMYLISRSQDMLELKCNVSVEFIYLIGCGI